MEFGGINYIAVVVAAMAAFAFGAVPHLKPAAQNDVIEQALGPVESARFYACVAALYAN